MARFIIRNYGPSRQIPYGKESICLSNDQCIETDDEGMADVLGNEDNMHVTDRGIEAIDASPEELAKMEKERQVTVDDPEAVHDEQFPDEDEQLDPNEIQQTDPEADGSEEIAYDEMTVPELRELAEDRLIEFTKGYVRKADLIEALVDYDNNQE